ncbi:unnamed protein product [Candidula unifasciata]|uniref:G-protein coupled receptors family 1 profile domain-containing protein n=1 Tax=Candidula unifasciata TaxID=100452 RepID=A0A8S3YNS5_9EUPU|nr:unnamed protein product [Candidula unifasciata]
MPTNLTSVHFFIFDDLSFKITMTIVTVNIVAFVGTISIFGIASNVINILVFSEQGFSETTNISYTALACSDLLTLMSTLCLSIFWNPLFLNSGLPLVFTQIQMAFAALPNACFSSITGLVTAFTSFERCLCVVWPLKVKSILTSTVTVIVIISFYLVMLLTMISVYSTFTLGWRPEPRTNRTLLGVIFVQNTEIISNISYLLHSVIQLLAFCAVSVCTVTLVVCLRLKTAWRTQQAEAQNAAKKATKRQDKAIKMVIFIAAAYVVGQLPTVVSFAVTVPYPSFGPLGKYRNFFIVYWSFSVLFGVLKSSVNLLVYYVMSSKFRQTCNQMLSLLLSSRIANYNE